MRDEPCSWEKRELTEVERGLVGRIEELRQSDRRDEREHIYRVVRATGVPMAWFKTREEAYEERARADREGCERNKPYHVERMWWEMDAPTDMEMRDD